MRTEDLLKQSQRLTSELQSQQEELRNTNDRLEQQAATLRQSEDLLRAQQEELRRKNDELLEKAQLLALEKKQVEMTNMEVEKAKQAVEEKAEQLALTSKYKSEFLANMSHELRTPLNSLLVLSKLLTENAEHNLTDKQVEFARTIYSSGGDLLALINEILDLSKIESGAMRIEVGELQLATLEENLRRTFAPMAADKGLEFTLEFDAALPPQVFTDTLRLQQVLFNLLSNAFKFTEQGGVSVQARNATSGWSTDHPVLTRTGRVVAFTIADTGIGISPENQKIIFEAFQQGDGSTSRKYGGTGLGLSISREIARLLGAEIVLDSAPGKGSAFTLYLPVEFDAHLGQERLAVETAAPRLGEEAVTPLATPVLLDDRRQLDGSVPAILIVEHDVEYARTLLDVVRDLGMRGVVVQRAREVLQMATDLRIDGMVFDIGPPDMDGWSLLDRLKHDPATRHIPVHVVSAQEQFGRGRSLGVFGFTSKPAEREELSAAFQRLRDFIGRGERRLLLVGSGSNPGGLAELLGKLPNTAVTIARHDAAAKEIAAASPDSIVLDLSQAPVQGIAFLRRLKAVDGSEGTHVIVHAPKKLSARHAAALQEAMPWINKRIVGDDDALLDEVTLFLHQRVDELPAEIRASIERRGRKDAVLGGARIAIIDDDIRNIFSLTSVLEQYGVEVVHAEDGRSGIELVRASPDLDLVLVDIMMPEMDGYETIRRIRDLGGDLCRLPLIAVTAKAMKGDRQKCLDAGASDYLAKPVDPDQLISKVRTWLHRMREAAE
jgi:signal transduction histidine kinase/CheY-like chemotaxis protein